MTDDESGPDVIEELKETDFEASDRERMAKHGDALEAFRTKFRRQVDDAAADLERLSAETDALVERLRDAEKAHPNPDGLSGQIETLEARRDRLDSIVDDLRGVAPIETVDERVERMSPEELESKITDVIGPAEPGEAVAGEPTGPQDSGDGSGGDVDRSSSNG